MRHLRLLGQALSRARGAVAPPVVHGALGLRLATVTGLSGGTAYLLTQHLPWADQTVALLTAVLVVQVSLHATVVTAAQRLIATLLGVSVGFGLFTFAGENAVTVALTVIASVLLGRAARLGDEALTVPITSLLVLTLTPPGAELTSSVGQRLAGTIVGGAVAIILSLFARKGTPERVSAAQLSELETRLRGVLLDIAELLRISSDVNYAQTVYGQAQRLVDDIHAAEPQVAEAEGFARWAPSASREKADELRRQWVQLRLAALQARGMARSAVEAVESGVRVPDAVVDVVAAISGKPGQQPSDVTSMRKHATEAVKDLDSTQPLLLSAALLAQAGRIDAPPAASAPAAAPDGKATGRRRRSKQSTDTTRRS